MPIVFASGETLGRLRFGSLLTHFPDHLLYLAQDEAKRRRVLVRQYAPADPERAMEGLPAAGRHAKSRWDEVLDQQFQRYELARRVLPKGAAAYVTFIDHIIDETFYAVMMHPASDALTTEFADIRAPSEAALQQLLLPILDVFETLHKSHVLYGALSPEEILLDHTDPSGLGAPVIAGFASVYHWRGMGPPRPRPDGSPGWAPEVFDRQAPLTAGADIYALGALAYRLMTGHSPAPAKDRLHGIEHPPVREAAASYSIGLKRAIDQALKLDPEARPPTVTAFRALAMPGVELLAAKPAARPRPVPAPAPAAASPPVAPVAPVAATSRPAPIVGAPAAAEPYLEVVAVAAREAPQPAVDIAPAAAREKPGPVRIRINPWQAVARAAGASRRTALGAVNSLSWAQPGVDLVRRQWQPFVAAVIALGLAGIAWWLKTEQTWPRGAFEPLGRPPISSSAPPPATTQSDAAKALADESALSHQPVKPAPAAPQSAPAATPAPVSQAQAPKALSAALIRSIQAELKRLGVFDGPIDGEDGMGLHESIAAAVAKFGGDLPTAPAKPLLTWLRAQSLAPAPPTAPAPPQAAPTATPAAEAGPAPFVVPARARRVVTPDYPKDALRRGFEGTIDVSFDIDPNGHVQNALVTGASSADAARYFSKEALRATVASTFDPALVGGKPDWSRGRTKHFDFVVRDR